MEKGKAYFVNHQYHLAIESFREFALANPDNPDPHFFIGASYNRMGKPNLALKSLEKAKKLGAHNHFLFSEMGSTLMDLERYAEAIVEFKNSLETDPKKNHTFYRLGLCYSRVKNWKMAIENFSESLKLDPENFETLFSRGGAYHNNKQLHEALKDLNLSLQIEPDCCEALYNRATVLFDLGFPDLAFDDLKKAFRICPEDADIRHSFNLFTFLTQEQKMELTDVHRLALEEFKRGHNQN